MAVGSILCLNQVITKDVAAAAMSDVRYILRVGETALAQNRRYLLPACIIRTCITKNIAIKGLIVCNSRNVRSVYSLKTIFPINPNS